MKLSKRIFSMIALCLALLGCATSKHQNTSSESVMLPSTVSSSVFVENHYQREAADWRNVGIDTMADYYDDRAEDEANRNDSGLFDFIISGLFALIFGWGSDH